jgi:hypothetical protein
MKGPPTEVDVRYGVGPYLQVRPPYDPQNHIKYNLRQAE